MLVFRVGILLTFLSGHCKSVPICWQLLIVIFCKLFDTCITYDMWQRVAIKSSEGTVDSKKDQQNGQLQQGCVIEDIFLPAKD